MRSHAKANANLRLESPDYAYRATSTWTKLPNQKHSALDDRTQYSRKAEIMLTPSRKRGLTLEGPQVELKTRRGLATEGQSVTDMLLSFHRKGKSVTDMILLQSRCSHVTVCQGR